MKILHQKKCIFFHCLFTLFPFDVICQIEEKSILGCLVYRPKNPAIHLSNVKPTTENIYYVGIWYLDKALHYKDGSAHFPRDMNFLQIVAEDWYKFLISPALRHHTWRGSRSSHPSRTSFRQLKMWIGSISSKVYWEINYSSRIKEIDVRNRTYITKVRERVLNNWLNWIIKWRYCIFRASTICLIFNYFPTHFQTISNFYIQSIHFKHITQFYDNGNWCVISYNCKKN